MTDDKINIIGKEEVTNLANEVLSKLFEISSTASKIIKETKRPSSHSIITSSFEHSEKAIHNLNRLNSEILSQMHLLSKEPSIARVLVEFENHERKIYYICRAMPVESVNNLASYRSHIGRLASLDIGDDLILPNGKIVTILDKAKFDPENNNDEWDARDMVIENELLKVITINSLRKIINSSYLKKTEKKLSINELIAEEEEEDNMAIGYRRRLIEKISLRDQPILDKFQDEIFRLSLSTKLLILGPPGTGKTTTLIKRLGQKLDFEVLVEKERNILESIQELSPANISAKTNWLMFTPTRLLKMYLKEAFSNEQVPATDNQISTWNDYSHNLARNSLGILRSSLSNKGFNLTEDVEHLNKNFFKEQIEFFLDFETVHQLITDHKYQGAMDKLLEYLELLDSRKCLEINTKTEIKPAITRLKKIFISAIKLQDNPYSSTQVFDTLVNLQKEAKELKEILKILQDTINEKLETILQKIINYYSVKHNEIYLDKIKDYLNQEASTKLKVVNEEDINYEEDEDEQEEIIEKNIIGRKKAKSEYLRVCKYLAYNTFIGKKINKDSKVHRFLSFLQENLPEENALQEIGFVVAIRKQLSYFSSPLKKYFLEINKSYRVLRKPDGYEKIYNVEYVKNVSSKWFSKNNHKNIKNNHVHALEVDNLILAHILISFRMFNNASLNIDINTDSEWQFLTSLALHYRAQIYVDEATDFSPIQLKCMNLLSYPGMGSFFASGDLNQRLTSWGTKNRKELEWVDKNLVTKVITTTYRQTEELCKLAEELIDIEKGDNIPPKLPENYNNSGTHPILLENAENNERMCEWISERIFEIETFTNSLPSIAIFVKNENEVTPIADLLEKKLSVHSIKSQPCHNGEVVGQNINVRVFDIQHIKGLEFEAVFLADINNFEKDEEELFGKYLYVGATRAATYLGICTKSSIPKKYSKIREYCKEVWSKA